MSEEYLRQEVNRLNNVIAERDYRITELTRENADLKARLLEWQLPNPAPFKLNPAMEALMKDPKPQGEE